MLVRVCDFKFKLDPGPDAAGRAVRWSPGWSESVVSPPCHRVETSTSAIQTVKIFLQDLSKCQCTTTRDSRQAGRQNRWRIHAFRCSSVTVGRDGRNHETFIISACDSSHEHTPQGVNCKTRAGSCDKRFRGQLLARDGIADHCSCRNARVPWERHRANDWAAERGLLSYAAEFQMKRPRVRRRRRLVKILTFKFNVGFHFFSTIMEAALFRTLCSPCVYPRCSTFINTEKL